MGWWPNTSKSASGILDYQNLLSLKIRGGVPCNAFTIRYRDARVHVLTAMRWFDTQESSFPMRNYFAQRWEERKDPFWWSVVASKSLESKRVVRSHASRMLRIAFTESLKKKGFARDGNTLDGSGGRPLTGTAQLTPCQDILKTRQSDLVLQTDAALESLLKYRDTKSGRKTGGASGGPAKAKKPKPKPWTQQQAKQGLAITKKRM